MAIASLGSIPVGGAIGFQDAQAGPAILLRTGQRQVEAFSRVCTHAGCLVGYDQQAEMIVCPCHGAEFDPRHGAQVVAGPAPAPLPPVRVSVGPSGEIFAGP
jgi:thiosulfate dehydrogenase [quinone] large subunit